MINLLPTEEKDALRRMYRLRIVVVALGLGALLIVVSLLLLLPSYIMLSIEEDDLTDALAHAKERHAALEGADQEVLRDLRNKIDLLGEPEGVAPTKSIDRILSHRAHGIAVTHIDVMSDEQVQIQGVADRRTTLTTFIDTLRGDSTFASVESPISSLIAESNAPFTITITLAHE